MVGAQFRPRGSWNYSIDFTSALNLVLKGRFVFPPTLCNLIVNSMNIEFSGKSRAGDASLKRSRRSGTTQSFRVSHLLSIKAYFFLSIHSPSPVFDT